MAQHLTQPFDQHPLVFEPLPSPDLTHLTPAMRQYHEIKQQHPDCLLFFRMGDFYELFFEDAIVAASALDITLTRRGKTQGEDIPMCGVPFHASDTYLARLIRKGHRVAICEQMEDPKERDKVKGKAPLRREVVRVVTPATLTEDSLLDHRRNNFLVAIAINPAAKDQTAQISAGQISLAALDISTGTFCLETVALESVAAALQRYNPQEILMSESEARWAIEGLPTLNDWQSFVVKLSDHVFTQGQAHRRMTEAYKVLTFEAWGPISESEWSCCGAVIDYIYVTQKGHLPYLDRPRKQLAQDSLQIDPATWKNLELTHTAQGEAEGSLLQQIDTTCTSAGARLLARRLASPLMDPTKIDERLDSVEALTQKSSLRQALRQHLKKVPDIERCLSRISLRRGGPRDLAALCQGLSIAQDVAALLQASVIPGEIQTHSPNLDIHTELLGILTDGLAEDLPLLARDGHFVKNGFNPELDRLRQLRDHGRHLVSELQAKYSQNTGIPSLKIKHNAILGYYIEITNTHVAKVPYTFFHRQTLINATRYTTAELNTLEVQLNEAHERALNLESQIFDDLCTRVLQASDTIMKTAISLAVLDVSTSLAELAIERKYCRPLVQEGLDFSVVAGRHPVVEAKLGHAQPTRGKSVSPPRTSLKSASSFAANDCLLDPSQKLWLLTGPNMAGKSTFLRQNALIVIMAHMGSFVPANSARIGVVDRLFSRVGAADDLARGRSTFMVEMIETATILHQATEKSLVILDEVGRGTSTFDGVSIAEAVIENLAFHNRCRCLFATHYHELTRLEGTLPSLKCFTMRVKEWQGDVIFLHEIMAGCADRSYGLHVAKLAGVPPSVLKRAASILRDLENNTSSQTQASQADQNHPQGDPKSDLGMLDGPLQPIKTPDHLETIAQKLATADIDQMTPRQGLEFLYQLKDDLARCDVSRTEVNSEPEPDVSAPPASAQKDVVPC